MSPAHGANRAWSWFSWPSYKRLYAFRFRFSDLAQPEMSPEMAEDDTGQSSTQDWQGVDAPSPTGSGKSDIDPDEDKADDADAPSQPIQKRRRVTRACDECRRKKIKCDGKQPCTHCSVYSYGMDAAMNFPRSFMHLLTEILRRMYLR